MPASPFIDVGFTPADVPPAHGCMQGWLGVRETITPIFIQPSPICSDPELTRKKIWELRGLGLGLIGVRESRTWSPGPKAELAPAPKTGWTPSLGSQREANNP